MTLDRALVEALEKDYRTAPITEPERVMVDYVVKLTKDATQVGKEDHGRLRKAGFDARYMAGGHFAWKAIQGPVRLSQLFQPHSPDTF